MKEVIEKTIATMSIDRSTSEGAAEFMTAYLTQASPTLKVSLRTPHLPEAILSMTGQTIWTLMKHHNWPDEHWPLDLLNLLKALPRKESQCHLLADHPNIIPALCVLCDSQDDADFLNENGIHAIFEWTFNGTLYHARLVCPPYSAGWKNSYGGYLGKRWITAPCGRTVKYSIVEGSCGNPLPTDGRCYNSGIFGIH